MKLKKDRHTVMQDSSFNTKNKKILFRPFSEKGDGGATQTKERSLSKGGEKQAVELDSMLPLFPNLEKFDHRNIIQYEDPDLATKCNSAIEQFKVMVDGLDTSVFSSKIFKEEIFKVFVICFNYLTKSLSSCIASEITVTANNLLNGASALNKFLLFTLGDRKNPLILSQLDVNLIQILKDGFGEFNKQINIPGSSKDITFAAKFLWFQIEALAMMVSLNEGRSFMKTAASDYIKMAFEMLERLLKNALVNPTLKDIHKVHLGDEETWQIGKKKHIKVAVELDKKKFSIIQLNLAAKTPQFNIRYINLYYILKILQLLSLEENQMLKERILELVATVLKDGSEFLAEKVGSKQEFTSELISDAEIAFNETLICFNIIKRIIPKIADPSAVLDKLGYIHFLKPVIENYLSYVLKLNLIPDIDYSQEMVSYKTMHGYVSCVFNFLTKLKNSKDLTTLAKISKIGVKGSTATILTLIEDILGKIIDTIDVIEGNSFALELLKSYITEYLFENRHSMSRQTAEYIIKLITSTRFHYTSPKSLEALLDSRQLQELLLEKITNERIVLLLKEIIEYDKAWAETILQHLIGLISSLLNREEHLFGLCKLILCGITGDQHDNSSFFKRLLRTKYEIMTYKMYCKIENKNESKAIRGFIDIKGTSEFIDILLTKFYKDKQMLVKNEIAMEMTENLFLELVSIPLVTEQLLNELPLVTKFMEYIKVGPDPRSVTIRFLEKLLAKIKYSTKPNERVDEKNNYLPLDLIKFIRRNLESGKPEDFYCMVPFIELIIRFVTKNPGESFICMHQIAVSNIIDLEEIFNTLNTSDSDQYIGKAIKLICMYMCAVQKNNEVVTLKINSSSLIRNKKIYSLIKAKILKGMLQVKEINEILQLLLEIIFEASVDFDSNSKKLLIKQFHFLKVYLAILSFLSRYSDWTKTVNQQCISLCKSIHGSYWNYLICSKNEIFYELLKLIRYHTKHNDILNTLIELCTNSVCVNGSSRCLKDFIGQLNIETKYEIQYELLFTSIFSSLAQILSSKSPREVFVFAGDTNSGIGLLSRKTLPKDGFCFCSSIWIERKDQSKNAHDESMTIFKLGASKTCEIELFLKDGYLNYQIKEAKGDENKQLITFTEMKLEEDKWYFIELYHIISESKKRLLLYINAKLVKETSMSAYLSKLTYDENTIGCGVQLDYVSKKGEESIINNFRGAMTTLYFLEVNNKTVEQMHSSLTYVLKSFGLENLPDCVTLTHDSKAGKSFDLTIVEKIFMFINPKYTEKLVQRKQKIHTIFKGGKNFDIYDSVERVYSGTIIAHNTMAKDTFLNIGGVKTVMPALHKILEQNPNPAFAYLPKYCVVTS